MYEGVGAIRPLRRVSGSIGNVRKAISLNTQAFHNPLWLTTQVLMRTLVDMASRSIEADVRASVLEAIEGGMAKSHAAEQFGVSSKTVARWASEAGVKGTYRPKGKPPVKRDRLMPFVLDLHRQHRTVEQIAAEAPEKVAAATIAEWLRHAGEKPFYAVTEDGKRKSGGRQRHPMFEVVREMYLVQRMAPRAISEKTGVSADQVSQWASRLGWSAEVGRSQADIPGRPRDPSLWATKACVACGEQMEFRKSQPRKFCSNRCAARHTSRRQHILIDEAFDMVLDSSYEALVWAALTVAKVPVERFDRQHGVEWGEGRWYAPDLWLPEEKIAIEVKGALDDNDAARWDAYRSTGVSLAVLDRVDLMSMSPATALAIVENAAY